MDTERFERQAAAPGENGQHLPRSERAITAELDRTQLLKGHETRRREERRRAWARRLRIGGAVAIPPLCVLAGAVLVGPLFLGARPEPLGSSADPRPAETRAFSPAAAPEVPAMAPAIEKTRSAARLSLPPDHRAAGLLRRAAPPPGATRAGIRTAGSGSDGAPSRRGAKLALRPETRNEAKAAADPRSRAGEKQAQRAPRAAKPATRKRSERRLPIPADSSYDRGVDGLLGALD